MSSIPNVVNWIRDKYRQGVEGLGDVVAQETPNYQYMPAKGQQMIRSLVGAGIGMYGLPDPGKAPPAGIPYMSTIPMGPESTLLKDEGGNPMTVYHGSPTNIQEFKVGQPGERTLGGLVPIKTESNAIFFTPEKGKAISWAQNRGAKPGQEFLHPSHLEMNKPLDLRDPSRLGWEGGPNESLLEYWRDKDPVLSKWPREEWLDRGIDIDNLEVTNPDLLHSLLDDKRIVQSLKNIGYDSAIIDEGKHPQFGGTAYAVFDPKQIRPHK